MPASTPDAAAREITQKLSCAKAKCPCRTAERKGFGLVHCPFHDDSAPSLNVSVKNDVLLVHCQATCSQEDVVTALRENDLWFVGEATTTPSKQIVATYDYFDAEGTMLYQAVRYSPKDFRQRRPDGKGGWIWDMQGVQRVPYRLPELLSADKKRLRFIVEGERDVETLEHHGMLATTNSGGAGKWLPEYSQSLRDSDVVLLPDNDAAGRTHAAQVAATLTGVAHTWRIIDLPHLPARGDVTDWLSNGGTPDILRDLIKTTKPFIIPASPEPVALEVIDKPDLPYMVDGESVYRRVQLAGSSTFTLTASQIHQERTGIHSKITLTLGDQSLAWTTFNIERDEDRVRLGNSAYGRLKSINAILAGTYSKDALKSELDDFCAGLWEASMGNMMPEYVSGSTERTRPEFLLNPFILAGGGTIIFAAPGRGKSFILMLMAVCMDAGLGYLWGLSKPTKVLFVNLERSTQSVVSRLGNINEALGLPRDRPLAMLNRRGRSLVDAAPAIEKFIKSDGIGCVMLDSLSRAGVGDLTENVNVNRNMDLMNRLCPSWAALGHTPRADDSHVFGGIHFDAAADLCVQLISQQEDGGPLGIGLNITKDNDVGKRPLWIGALEFSDTGLMLARPARPGEFVEVERGRKSSMRDQVIDFLRDTDSSKANATDIAEQLSFDRSNIARLLTKDDAFVLLEKNNQGAFYGLAAR